MLPYAQRLHGIEGARETRGGKPGSKQVLVLIDFNQEI
jgi:hypothetical protein